MTSSCHCGIVMNASTCNASSSCGHQFVSQFSSSNPLLANGLERAVEDTESAWASAMHVAKLNEVPGASSDLAQLCSLQLIGKWNHQMEHLAHFVCLSTLVIFANK